MNTTLTRSAYKALNRALYAVGGITLKGDRDYITAARIIAVVLEENEDADAEARLVLHEVYLELALEHGRQQSLQAAAYAELRALAS